MCYRFAIQGTFYETWIFAYHALGFKCLKLVYILFHRISEKSPHLLVEIRDLPKSPATTASNTEDIDNIAIDSEQGFEALERRLENRDFKASFVSNWK